MVLLTLSFSRLIHTHSGILRYAWVCTLTHMDTRTHTHMYTHTHLIGHMWTHAHVLQTLCHDVGSDFDKNECKRSLKNNT